MEVAGAVARTYSAGYLLDPELHQVLDGALTEGTGDELHILDPTTGEVLARGAAAGPREVDAAVKSARRAHERSWGKVAGLTRTRHLLALARALSDHADELAAVEALDLGTPLRQAREQSVAVAQAHLLHHAGWADKLLHAGLGPAPDGGSPRPAGVSLHLLSRTACLSDVVRTVAAALGTGCTVVVVAPAATPLASLALGRLALQVGLPPGVLTVLTAPSSSWPLLVNHRGFDVLTCTGSAPAAATLARAMVGLAAPLHTDVRSDDVVIALDDGDSTRNAAVQRVVSGICMHGHRPAGSLRLLVPTADVASTLDRLRPRLAALTVGDPLAPATEVGPLPDLALLDDAHAVLATAAQCWTAPAAIPTTGWFLAPGLTVEATRQARGPVVQVNGYTDAEHLRRLVGGDRHATVRLLGGEPTAARAIGASLRGLTTVGTRPCTTTGFVGPAGYLGG